MQEAGATIDISSAITKELVFAKPDNTTTTKTATFTTDGTDGQMEYVTLADDLDTVGMWKLQASFVFPTGTWKSSVASFEVHANL